MVPQDFESYMNESPPDFESYMNQDSGDFESFMSPQEDTGESPFADNQDLLKVKTPDWAAKMMADIVGRGGTEEDFMKAYDVEKQRRIIRQFGRGFINTGTLGLAKPLTKKLVPEQPEGVGEKIASQVGQFGGFLAGGPMKIGKAVGGIAVKGVSRLLGKGAESVVGQIVNRLVGGGATLGTASAVEDITMPKEMPAKFASGALLGEVFAGTGLVNLTKHPLVSQAMRQVGGRVLLNLVGQYPRGIQDPEAFVDYLKQNPEAVYHELMNTYFLAQGRNPSEMVKAKILNEAMRKSPRPTITPDVAGIIPREQMPPIESKIAPKIAEVPEGVKITKTEARDAGIKFVGESRIKATGFKHQKDWLMKKVGDAISTVPEEGKPGPETVIFDVPGDGQFEIINIKSSLEAFKKRLSNWPTGRIEVPRPSMPSLKPKSTAELYYEVVGEGQGEMKIPEENLVFLRQEKGWKEYAGDPVDIGSGIDAFAVKKDNRNWGITEARTGLLIGNGGTKAKAISNAAENIEKRGLVNTQKLISDNEKKTGISPLYSRPTPIPKPRKAELGEAGGRPPGIIPPSPAPIAPIPLVRLTGIKGRLSNLYQRLISQGLPTEKLNINRPLQPGEDPDILYAANRKVSALIEATMKFGPSQLNPGGTFTVLGEGLDPIVKDYRKTSPVKSSKEQDLDLNAYRKSVRVIEDLQRPAEGAVENIATPQQVAEAQETLVALRQKYGQSIGVLENTSKRMTDFSNNVLKSGIGTVLSQESYDRIIAKNPHFAPFDKILIEVESHAGPSLPTATTTIKKIRGVSDELAGTIGATYERAEKYIKAVENERVKLSLYNLASDIPDQVRLIEPGMRPIRVTEGEAGIDKTIFRPSERPPSPMSVPLFVNGEKKWMEVSQPIYDALVSATPESANFVHGILRSGASFLRRGATMTIDFMTRNLFRDQLTAGLQTQHGFVPFLSIPKAMASIMRRGVEYQEFLRAGVARSGFVGKNRADIEKAYRNISKSRQLIGRLNIFKDLEDLSSFFEKTTRMGTYQAARKAGLSPLEAGKEAAEGTVDFSRIGRDTKSLNQTIAFMNAGIQGPDRFMRAYRANPVGMTVKGLITITLPSLIEYYYNNDDQDYQDLPAWDKYGFWHPVKIGHTYLRIPKPFLPGIVFGTVPQQFAEFIHHRNPRAFEGLVGSLVGAASPVGEDIVTGLIPTGMKPLIENASPQGWSFFRDRPIVPEGKKGLPPEEQYATYTSETAKKLGKILGVSPAKVENLVQGITGGMGKYALDIGDIALKTVGLAEPLAGEKNRPTELTDILGFRGWLSQPVYYLQSNELQHFYENKQKVNSWNKAFEAAKNRGDINRVREIKNKHPEIRISSTLDSFAESVSEYRKRIERIATNKTMPDKVKRKAMSDLAHKIIKATQARNKMFDQLAKNAGAGE